MCCNGWTSKTLCYVKDARHNRKHILYDPHCEEILRIGKSTGKESRLVTARDKREKQGCGEKLLKG